MDFPESRQLQKHRPIAPKGCDWNKDGTHTALRDLAHEFESLSVLTPPLLSLPLVWERKGSLFCFPRTRAMAQCGERLLCLQKVPGSMLGTSSFQVLRWKQHVTNQSPGRAAASLVEARVSFQGPCFSIHLTVEI